LQPLLRLIATLNDEIKTFDQRIEKLAADKYMHTQLLRQVSGVGPVTALAYVLTLETPLRFARSRDVGPYLGLVPKQEDSGDIQPQLGISKAGDRIHWRVLASREQGAWGGLRGGRIRWKTSNLSMKMVSKTGLNR
jgi:transposase